MKNTLLKQELLSVFRNKKLLIPIIAVLFIPVLYSGMFLWAFWDPYERLTDLPVAVANMDEGSTIDGERMELGDELVAKLKDSKDFSFEFVGEAEGKEGLKQQEYYMLIKIPKNFSENATTLLEDDPQKLELVYMPNESYNFLSAQIGETAVDRIKTSVSEKVSETYAETMFEKISELADGLGKASEGAAELNDGVGQLKEGSAELYQNLEVLAGKSVEFKDGINTANAGVKQVEDGAGALANGLGQLEDGHAKLEGASNKLLSGEKDLSAGITKTKEGLEQVNSNIPTIVGGTDQLSLGSEQLVQNLSLWQSKASEAAVGATQLNAGIQELKKQIEPMILANPELAEAIKRLEAGSAGLAQGTDKLSSSAGELSAGAGKLKGGIDELNAGQKEMQKGVAALSEGSIQLETGANTLTEGQEQFNQGMITFGQKLSEAKNGAEKLSKGSLQLSGGMDQLANGSSAMAEGADKLSSGAEQLAEGNSKVANGTTELADKLKTGAEEAKVKSDQDTYNMLAAPVKVDNEKMNKVPNYGTGFAPYFLSLGLFVGALLLSIVFPLREPAGVPTSGYSWFRSKFIILTGIGIVQALIADVILLEGLGLQVKSLPLFLLFSIVTSLTFISLIQLLVTTLGDPGRFVAILLLILQLTTSAGTFPLELIPGFLQKFNAFLPMTYSVQGFKAVISSGDMGFMWENASILSIYIIVMSKIGRASCRERVYI